MEEVVNKEEEEEEWNLQFHIRRVFQKTSKFNRNIKFFYVSKSHTHIHTHKKKRNLIRIAMINIFFLCVKEEEE